MLGKYTYQPSYECNGIESAVEFGPFIIVNGNKSNKIVKCRMELHPRTGDWTKKRWNINICS